MKNVITMEEREIIFDNMVKLLDEYNYNWDADSIYKIIDTWAENKADLIALFKNHPNYVEGKFMIAFNTNWSREIDANGARKFSEWMFDHRTELFLYIPEEIKERVRKYSYNTWYSNVATTEETAFLVNCSNYYAHQFVSESMAEFLNDIDPSLRFKEGMKMSRAINKICTWLGYNKHPDYNREFAKYADSVNPLKIVRHTVISINPIDYLTMSFGNSWASCHTIDKHNRRGMPNSYHGQYSSGTVSYMLDKVSMIFYTVDAGYNGDDYYFESKINRCVFHYGNEKLIQGRVYPQSNDSNPEGIYKDIREIVQRVISTCLNIPNYWDTRRGTSAIYDYVCTEGTHYADYRNYDNCCISFPKGKEVNNNAITIGHWPICINCGNEHDCCENIDHCIGNRVECASCGRLIDEDDAHFIDGNWYCNECSYYCEHCGNYFVTNDARWVESVHGYVCDECIEEDFTFCDECETYHRDHCTTFLENYDRDVCDDCLRVNYTQCDRCGNWIRDEDVNTDAQCNSYCDSCWEEICAENENEEEAM